MFITIALTKRLDKKKCIKQPRKCYYKAPDSQLCLSALSELNYTLQVNDTNFITSTPVNNTIDLNKLITPKFSAKRGEI